MILHCEHSDVEFLVVSCKDTDVFFLLVSHIDKMSCKQSRMEGGTSQKPKYLPIHTIRERLKKQFLSRNHSLVSCSDRVRYGLLLGWP